MTHNGQLSMYVCVFVVRGSVGEGACLEGRGRLSFFCWDSLYQIVSDGAWCLQHSIKQSIKVATQQVRASM